jgi:hypothetical protein
LKIQEQTDFISGWDRCIATISCMGLAIKGSETSTPSHDPNSIIDKIRYTFRGGVSEKQEKKLLETCIKIILSLRF